VISAEKKEEKEAYIPGRYTRREFNYGAKKSFSLDDGQPGKYLHRMKMEYSKLPYLRKK
jgi:hypothetical protein